MIQPVEKEFIVYTTEGETEDRAGEDSCNCQIIDTVHANNRDEAYAKIADVIAERGHDFDPDVCLVSEVVPDRYNKFFFPGEKVWAMVNNKPKEVSVHQVLLVEFKDGRAILNYRFERGSDATTYSENDVFKTKKELCEYLFGEQ